MGRLPQKEKKALTKYTAYAEFIITKKIGTYEAESTEEAIKLDRKDVNNTFFGSVELEDTPSSIFLEKDDEG